MIKETNNMKYYNEDYLHLSNLSFEVPINDDFNTFGLNTEDIDFLDSL